MASNCNLRGLSAQSSGCPIPARTPDEHHASFAALCRCGHLVVTMAAAKPRLVVMHGYADYTSAIVWIQTDAPGAVQRSLANRARRPRSRADARRESRRRRRRGRRAAYRTGAGRTRRRTRSTATAIVAKARCAHNRTGLRGDRRARRDDRDRIVFLSSADAEPPWSASTYGGGFEIFDAIAAKAPDLMVWLGDNLYFQAARRVRSGIDGGALSPPARARRRCSGC